MEKNLRKVNLGFGGCDWDLVESRVKRRKLEGLETKRASIVERERGTG